MVLIIIILVLVVIVSVAAFSDDSDRTIDWEDIERWEQDRQTTNVVIVNSFLVCHLCYKM